MKCNVYYYQDSNGHCPFQIFLNNLTLKQQTKTLRLIHLIQEYGLTSVIPHIKKLAGTQLWELRILGKDNIRTIYMTKNNCTVIILHGFIKKSTKTSHLDIMIAQRRYFMLDKRYHKRYHHL